MLFVQRARHAAAALAKTPVHARTLASLPDQGPEVVSGLQPSKVDAANKLGFKEDEGIVAFGAGAVNNTLLALMSQVSSNLSLVSRYADDIEKDGVTLHHRGDEYVVPAGDIKLPQTSVIKELGEKIASPRIVLNGRQLGGDYDEIFDSMGPATEFVVTAQNGPSARMLADAAQKYVERHPEKKAILENVVGPVSASFRVIDDAFPSSRRWRRRDVVASTELDAHDAVEARVTKKTQASTPPCSSRCRRRTRAPRRCSSPARSGCLAPTSYWEAAASP